MAALGIGIWAVSANRNSDPVLVFEFMHVGMTEYWGDSQESYGPITTDRVQTVFLSDTQTVTEIFVQSGDTVKKGDVLGNIEFSLDGEVVKSCPLLAAETVETDDSELSIWQRLLSHVGIYI